MSSMCGPPASTADESTPASPLPQDPPSQYQADAVKISVLQSLASVLPWNVFQFLSAVAGRVFLAVVYLSALSIIFVVVPRPPPAPNWCTEVVMVPVVSSTLHFAQRNLIGLKPYPSCFKFGTQRKSIQLFHSICVLLPLLGPVSLIYVQRISNCIENLLQRTRIGTIFTIYAQRKSNCIGNILQRKRIGALSLLYAQQKFLCSLSVPDIGRTIFKRCWLLEKVVLVLYCAPILGYQGCPSFAPLLGYLRDAPLPTAHCLFPLQLHVSKFYHCYSWLQ